MKRQDSDSKLTSDGEELAHLQDDALALQQRIASALPTYPMMLTANLFDDSKQLVEAMLSQHEFLFTQFSRVSNENLDRDYEAMMTDKV